MNFSKFLLIVFLFYVSKGYSQTTYDTCYSFDAANNQCIWYDIGNVFYFMHKGKAVVEFKYNNTSTFGWVSLEKGEDGIADYGMFNIIQNSKFNGKKVLIKTWGKPYRFVNAYYALNGKDVYEIVHIAEQ